MNFFLASLIAAEVHNRISFRVQAASPERPHAPGSGSSSGQILEEVFLP